MNVSNMPIVERIARVLAGQRLSSNAHGTEDSAGPDVDANWRLYREDALEILRTLRDPDQTMARAGNVVNWQSMVRAALRAYEGDSAANDSQPPGPKPRGAPRIQPGSPGYVQPGDPIPEDMGSKLSRRR